MKTQKKKDAGTNTGTPQRTLRCVTSLEPVEPGPCLQHGEL